MAEKNGLWVANANLDEKNDLQRELLKHLRSREKEVSEGAEVGGGESDVILFNTIVVENKVRRQETVDPLVTGEKYEWQARRYSIAVCQKIVVTLIAYKPKGERSILPLPERIQVVDRSMDGFLQIRVLVPWGHSVPSAVQTPSSD